MRAFRSGLSRRKILSRGVINAKDHGWEILKTITCITAKVAMIFMMVMPSLMAQAVPGDLTKLSVEDLMNVEVTSVSKKQQKVSRVASTIFVLTEEDIQNSGARNLPDILRMVPGLDVAQINGNTWAVSARGLNGQFSSDLLVLLDGRDVYSPTFGGVFWDTFDMLLDDIDRIEIICGPGGSIWGENAVNGVINIITKKAADTKGTTLIAGGGNTYQTFGTAQFGGKLGQKTDYRVYARYFDIAQSQAVDGGQGRDGWHTLRGGFRSDTTLTSKDNLTVQGDMYSGRQGDVAPTITSITAAGPMQKSIFVNLSGGYIQGIWNHTRSEESGSTLMLSYDQYRRDDLLTDQRKTFNLDFHDHLKWGDRNQIVWGLAYRGSFEASVGNFEISFLPPREDYHVFSGFLQDEVAIFPNRLYVTLGAKFEHNSYSGFAVLPSVRAVYQFNERKSIWAAASRAIRSPAEINESARFVVTTFILPDGTPAEASVIGNANQKNETADVYEIGYRASFNTHFSVDLEGYYNIYGQQASIEPGKPFFDDTILPGHLVFPLNYANLTAGEAHGLEMSATWKVTDHWTLSPSYDFERIHFHPEASSLDTAEAALANGSDPHEHARLRSRVELPHHVNWNTLVYFTSPLAYSGVPSYTRIDANLLWQCNENLRFGIYGQNLLREQHLEFLNGGGATAATLVRRSYYAKLTWKF